MYAALQQHLDSWWENQYVWWCLRPWWFSLWHTLPHFHIGPLAIILHHLHDKLSSLTFILGLMVQTPQESGTSSSSGIKGLSFSLCTLKWQQHAPLWELATLEGCYTHTHTHTGEINGSKQSTVLPFHVQQKGLNTSCECKWSQWNIPAKETWSASLERSFEVTWVPLHGCTFACVTSAASYWDKDAENKGTTVSMRKISVTQYSSAPLAPRDTQHTWLTAQVPQASFTWHQDFLSKAAFQPKKKKDSPHACQSVSSSFQKVAFTVTNTDSWYMIYSTVNVRILLTHLTSSEARTSIRWHKQFLLYVRSGDSCSHQVFLVFTITLVPKTILSGQTCPNRCAHDFLK